MLNWNYDHQDYLNGGWEPIPPGPHRVRIDKAEETVSKSGRDMVKLTLDVSGHRGHVYYYLVFLPDHKEMTNKNLGDIFESFGIPQGQLELLYWIGKVGAAELKTEVHDGKEHTRVSFFLDQERQKSLPPWQEPGGDTGGGVMVPEMVDLDTDAPF